MLAVLAGMLGVSFLLLLHSFYIENTEIVAVQGGTYIEGSVGEVPPLNPWFTGGNDVGRDIISLVFAGLMKYDPATGKVVDDLAHVDISNDNRTFTAKLKDGLMWQDSTSEVPHPVTADDVLFTFQTISQPGFSNPILQQNFRGVDVKKIDDRTVKIKEAEGTRGKLKDTLDFGFHPIGAGAYSFVSLLQTDLSTEVTLKRFNRPSMPSYNIDRIVFRVFPDYPTLLTDIVNLNGVRVVPRNDKGQPILPKHFKPVPYTLPQYVGLFFNMDHSIPADRNVRLGLQLGTNKQEVVDAIHETKIIDTPLLEIDLADWRYKFDSTAAKGAFFASSWNIPEKIRLQRLLEQRNTNAVGPLKNVQRVVYLGTGAELILTGSTVNLTFPVFVNGVKAATGSKLPDGTLKAFSGSWLVHLSTGNGMSGSLKLGTNIVKMTDSKGEIVDSAFLQRYATQNEYTLASAEQSLVNQFLASKQLASTNPAYITVDGMYLENGFLREKKPDDPPHTRLNDNGKPLKITLLTSNAPETYAKVANIVADEWRSLGADVTVDIPATKQEFQDKLLKRNYDVVLFGESLFDNLDSYPYWHSSQIQAKDDPKNMRLDAFNLSQYTSFDTDALLAKIRETSDASSRANSLKELNEILKRDVPAIILYSPLYVFAYDQNVHGVHLDKLSLHADRFADFEHWYVTTERRFTAGKGWLSFIPWLLHLQK